MINHVQNSTINQLTITCITVSYNHSRARVHHANGGESRGINYAAPALWKNRCTRWKQAILSTEQVNPGN